MATYSTNEFKVGLKVMIGNDPCTIVENEFVKPGKGQAFNRVKLRNLKTLRIVEKTYKSGENLEAADVIDLEMRYLYTDNTHWYFMRTDTFEQYEADHLVMQETKQWLKGDEMCAVTLWNNEPLSVLPPNFVELVVAKTDPGVRGDTATGGSKNAVVETGAVVKVPLFVEEGDIIKIDTRTSTYLGRTKK